MTNEDLLRDIKILIMELEFRAASNMGVHRPEAAKMYSNAHEALTGVVFVVELDAAFST